MSLFLLLFSCLPLSLQLSHFLTLTLVHTALLVLKQTSCTFQITRVYLLHGVHLTATEMQTFQLDVL